jgi:hypothetical protein
MVSFLYGSESRVKLLITELQGDKAYETTEFLAPGKARFEFGGAGDWLVGDRGPLAYRGADGERHVEHFRLPGNTLLLERRQLVITIEGKLTRAEATTIAMSLRPQS